ncbi:hypothetical protein HK16_01110 [Acetobacter senegalensis]|uniref:Uncharacterized protein n=2 Tax=Acetobacter TaxID=434 RepID=A0A252EEG3_9PROT|nr:MULTISPECIES: hypothetical protein [Acetobacter]ATJ90455.1 hypothetical protein CIW82_06880 [Acetobacter tropicalis]OUL64870.1 hypothetical protein HK16_01110 [Acetobacter senegalensis]
MPTLTVNGRDVQVGDEFLRLSPEQQNATVDEIARSMGVSGNSSPPEAPGIANGIGRGFATGVPVIGGLLNKADAATNATLAPVLNGLFSPDQQLQGDWSQRYHQALAAQNGADQQFAQQHPVLNTGAQIAGGIGGGAMVPVLGSGYGLLARAAVGAAENSALGGLDAYARGGNAAHGALIGAGMGVGGAAVSHLGRSDLLGMLGRHLAGVGLGAAGGAASAGLEGADPLTGAMAGAMTGAAGEAASAAAKPLSAAARTFDKSAGENKTDRLFNARDVAAQKVAEAATLTNQELAARLKEYGKNATLMDVDPALAQAAGAIGTQSGRGQTFLRNVTDKREVQSGKRVSDLIAQTIGPRGDGDALLSALDAEKKAAAGPFYASSLPTPVQDSDELQAIMETPAFRSALSRANTLAGNEGRSLYTKKGHPDVSNMTIEDLHYIQRAMQDNIGEIKAGAGFKDNEASRSVAGVRQRLLAQMDAMSPDYQQARSIYSGSSRVRDAYDAGFGAFDNSTGVHHLTNEMMERQLAGYDNQAERQAYLLGARQRVSNIFGAARNNRQRAYTLFGIGNDNPEFENTAKLATLLAHVKPAANQEAALGAMQDDMRSRLGYTIASPEEEPITPDSVHGPDNPLVNEAGELVHPDSDEGKQIISKRIADAEADRQAKAEEFAKQKAAALEFTGPDKARGKSLADALISGLKAERQFGETRDEVSGNSKTARRIEGKKLIASPEVEIPNNLPSGVARIAAALVNAAAGRTMRRRADAVNYEIARIVAGNDTSFIPRSAAGRDPNPQPNEPTAQSVPVSKIDPITDALMRNPGIQERKIKQDALTQALLTAAITQSNIQGGYGPDRAASGDTSSGSEREDENPEDWIDVSGARPLPKKRN